MLVQNSKEENLIPIEENEKISKQQKQQTEEEDYAEEEEEEEEGEEQEHEEGEDYEDLRRDYINRISYSERYQDDKFEYRHVILPREYYTRHVDKSMKSRLLSEEEWRSIGIQQSPGWIHYELHKPELHVFLFKRPL